MPDYEYQDFMIFTGITNQHLGRLYTCPLCKRRYWSVWGHARRHFEKEFKNHPEEVKAIIKKSGGIGMSKWVARDPLGYRPDKECDTKEEALEWAREFFEEEECIESIPELNVFRKDE